MGCGLISGNPQEIVGSSANNRRLTRKFLAEKAISLGNIYTQALIVKMSGRTCEGAIRKGP